jgi:hypothetical protein
MKKYFRGFCLLVISALLAACVTTRTPPPYIASFMDSFALPNALDKKRFVILPGTKDTDSSDLQFLEFSKHVEKVLGELGLNKAKSFADAEIAIFLSYGIGNPQIHQYSYNLPVWGQTGVSSATTYGNISSFGSTGIYSGTTTYTPTYGITGYTSHVNSSTTFTRFMLIDAYDLESYKNEQKMTQVWKTSVTSTGSSNDLRYIFPYMAVAMKKFVAINTGRQIEEDVLVDDLRVSKLRDNSVE